MDLILPNRSPVVFASTPLRRQFIRSRIFLVSLLSAVASALIAQDTLTSVTEGFGPQTFSELWSEFDPRREPLEEEILHEWEEDSVKMRVLRYRVGQFKGKQAKVAAIYAYPLGGLIMQYSVEQESS